MIINVPDYTIHMAFRFREKSVSADNVWFDEGELDLELGIQQQG